MRHVSRRLAFTLLESICVVTICATLAMLLYPALHSAVTRGKITRSIGNMRQLHAAVILYTNGDGDLEAVPAPGPPLERFWAELPAGIRDTGAGGAFHVYRTMWLYPPEIWRAQWSEDCRAARENPAIFLDDTYPVVQEHGPFVKSHHVGIFWDGHIATRWYAGSAGAGDYWLH